MQFRPPKRGSVRETRRSATTEGPTEVPTPSGETGVGLSRGLPSNVPDSSNETSIVSHIEDTDVGSPITSGGVYGRTMGDLGHEVLTWIKQGEQVYVLFPAIFFLVAIWAGQIKSFWDILLIAAAGVSFDLIVLFVQWLKGR